ncbi:MAG: hypothetical protein Q8R53_03315 [Nanoarchaeota archaeon]|nr:hypothetical protein [Nanoarchaeota archaeon]
MNPTLSPYCTQRLPWSIQDSPASESIALDLLNASLNNLIVAEHLQDVVREAMTTLAQLPELELALHLIGRSDSSSARKAAGDADLFVYHHPFRGEDKYIIAPAAADMLLRYYLGKSPGDGHCLVDDIDDNVKDGITRITLATNRMYVFHKEAGNVGFLLKKKEPSPLIVPLPFGFYQKWRREAGLPVRK